MIGKGENMSLFGKKDKMVEKQAVISNDMQELRPDNSAVPPVTDSENAKFPLLTVLIP